MNSRLLLLLLALWPRVSAAQRWAPDAHAHRLAWGTANVVVRSDTADGVQVWAATSQAHSFRTPHREFAARFDPDSIVRWLQYANLVLQGSRPPTQPTAYLRTPPLLAIDGSQVILDRDQKAGAWSNQVRIVFTAPEGQLPWSIAAQLLETKALLDTLFQSASQSSYLPQTARPLEPNPADSASCPRPLAQPVVHFPSRRQRTGQGGDVWLTFVVRANGTVDPARVRVLITDGEDFTEEAVRAVMSVQYRPATTGAGPQDALAFQRVSFVVRE